MTSAAPPRHDQRARLIARRSGRPAHNPVRIEGHDASGLRERIDRGPALVLEQPWRSSRGSWRIRVALLLPVLLFVFSLSQNLGNMDTVDFHRDEARWINRASFLGELLHPFSESWSDYYTTRGQPPLGNYLMGAGLLLQGRDLDTNRVWDFSYDESWNIRAGAYPDTADLLAGRRTNAVVGALVVIAVYTMACKLTNRVGGVIAGFSLSVHPLHLRLSSQALSDELLALTIVGSLLAAHRFARKRDLGSGLLLGTLLGLGGAAKLSPLLMSVPLAAYGALWLWLRYRERGRDGVAWEASRFGWLLVLQPSIAFATFILVNPFLWPSPLRRSLAQFTFRRSEMEGQSAAWPIAGVDGPLGALARTGHRLDVDYSSSMRLQDWLGNLASISFQPISFDVVLMAAGAVTLVAIVVRSGLWSPPGITAFLMAGQGTVVIVGMGVDFYRYFLPLLVIGAVCLGTGGGAAFEAIRLRRTRQSAPAVRRTSERLPATLPESGYNHAGIGLSDEVPAQPSSAQ